MDKGEIIEEGNHEQLLRKQGYYYRLWTGQTLEELNEAAYTKLEEKTAIIANPLIGGLN